MAKNKSILLGVSVDYFGTAIVILATFVAIPFYLTFISKDQYGLWIAINSIVLMVSLVDLAADQFLTTVTANDERFYSEEYVDYLASIFFVKAISALMVVLISSIVFILLSSILGIEENLKEESQRAFALAVFALVLGIFSNAIPTILYARHYYSLVNTSINSILILTIVGTVLFLWMGYGIIAFPMAQLIGMIIQGIVLLFFLRGQFSHVKLRIKGFKFVGKSELLGYATNFQGLRWLYTFRAQYISIAINNFVGAAYLAQYILTSRLAQLGPTLSAKLANAFLPKIANLIEVGDSDKVVEIFIKLSKVLMRVAIFSGIILFALNKSFVVAWVGAGSYAGNHVMIFIVANMVIYMAMAQFSIVIFASKKFENWVYWSVLEMIAAAVFSYLLSRWYGLAGILMGFLFSSLPTQIYLFRIVLRQLNIGALKFFKAIFGYALKPNIISLVVAITMTSFQIEAKTWWGVIGLTSIFFITHLVFEIIQIFKIKNNGLKNKILSVLRV